jgi:glucokinase
MNPEEAIFLGTDSGATTSKTAGVRADGSVVSMQLRQSSTNAQAGTAAVISGWVEGAAGFLADNDLSWDRVAGVGLALPGPFRSYGVLDRTSNMPLSFAGWNFLQEYGEALSKRAGRQIPLVAGNDGNYGGVAEAHAARGSTTCTVLMLAPGSGLGVAYIGRDGLPLEGDTLAGMEGGHMPAPLQLLGNPRRYRCGCGRDWGCIEPYTTISGLPQLLEDTLPRHPNHPLASSSASPKEKALSLRGLAQKGDALALEIFDFQARALGLHLASMTMALDAELVVIGGGLMDPGATTDEFRKRYLDGVRAAAEPYLFPEQRKRMRIVPATLGELSQAIGAALVALFTSKSETRSDLG